MDAAQFPRWFRDSTPYISTHRNKTFVVLVPGEVFDEATENQTGINLLHDLALVSVLGVRLILVHGARPQIDAALGQLANASKKASSSFHGYRRITRPQDMDTIAAINGQLRARIEAIFCMGLPNTPLHNTNICVLSGNFIAARPLGVIDGVDHQLTGRTRSFRRKPMLKALDDGNIILISPLGYSPSGEKFNLNSEELAADLAVGLQADKLIIFDQHAHLRDESGSSLSEITPSQLDRLLDQVRDSAMHTEPQRQRLRALLRATRAGVPRGHIISYLEDGSLLKELYTAPGCGTQISDENYQTIRPAQEEDVAGIVELIRPLEESGVLVRRSRDLLEQQLTNFLVAEIDQIVVGCCALTPLADKDSGELSCLVCHPSYRQSATGTALGASLLLAAEKCAREQHMKQLFVLTTQSRDWFIEHGFSDTTPEKLPGDKRALYNLQRNSKVLKKQLS